MYFKEINLDDWSDYKKLIDTLDNSWIYRGQSQKDWEITSSLQRLAFDYQKFNGSYPNILKFEEILFYKFREKAHSYLDHRFYPKSHEMSLEWLSIMQHYGVPTRLIDWTRSPYIASFFALNHVNDLSGQCSVWAINTKWLMQYTFEFIREKRKVILDRGLLGLDINLFGKEKYFQRYIIPKINEDERTKKDLKIVVRAEPTIMNERLIFQKGLFLCWNDIFRQFKDIIINYDDVLKNVIKINLPNNLRNLIINDLNKMNISEEILFPGIDGFSRSLRNILLNNNNYTELFYCNSDVEEEFESLQG